MVLHKGALWLLSTATRGTTMTAEQRTNCVSGNTYQKYAQKHSKNEESRIHGLKSHLWLVQSLCAPAYA
jgi:hypothetical protein